MAKIVISFINWAHENKLNILLRAIYWPFLQTNQMESYWLSLTTATIQHPIKLSLSTCFSLSLSLSLTTQLPSAPPPPQPTVMEEAAHKMQIWHM